MDLTTHNGLTLISEDDIRALDNMAKQAIKVRRSIS